MPNTGSALQQQLARQRERREVGLTARRLRTPDQPPTPPNDLFQVPLPIVDVLNAKLIVNQRRERPYNCFSASAKILGLFTPRMTEYYSAWDTASPTRQVSYWTHALSFDGNTYTLAQSQIHSFSEVINKLFPGCATFLIIGYTGGAHAVVVSKDANGSLAMIDLQQDKLLSNVAEIDTYLRVLQGGATSLEIGVFKRDRLANLLDVLYFSYIFRSSGWLMTDAQVDELTRRFPHPDLDGDIPMLLGGLRAVRKSRGSRKTRRLTARARSRLS